MTTRNIVVAVGLLALFTLPIRAKARLDESIAQCEARYGKPTTFYDTDNVPGGKRGVYQKNGIDLIITFYQGRAGDIIFQKVSRTPFTQAELDALLAANRGASSWGKPDPSDEPNSTDRKPDLSWERADGDKALYTCLSDGRTLIVTTKVYQDAFNAALEKEAAAKKKTAPPKALDGF